MTAIGAFHYSLRRTSKEQTTRCRCFYFVLRVRLARINEMHHRYEFAAVLMYIRESPS